MEVLSKGPYSLGEGSIWDARLQRLYWIDIEGKRLHFRDFPGETQTRELSGMPGTVVLTQDPEWVMLAQDDGVKKLHVPSSEVKHLLDFPESAEFRFNDGKCDPAGRFWVGTMERDGKQGAGTLYRLDPDLSLNPVLVGVTCSNGIVWNQDATLMHYIDSATRQVQTFEYSQDSGEIANRRITVEIPEGRGYPDGMTIDREDRLWVAHWIGNCVACYDPETGETLQVLEVPTPRVTSCAFGGPHLDTLYITTALGSNDGGWTDVNEFPLTGAVFESQVGAKGVEAGVFGG